MKNLLLSLVFVGLAQIASAVNYIEFSTDRTSDTSSADTLKRFIGSGPGDVFTGYHVNRCGGLGSGFTVYDSSAQAANKLFSVDTSSIMAVSTAVGCEAIGVAMFSIPISSGITYSVTGTVPPDVTFFWHNKDRQKSQD